MPTCELPLSNKAPAPHWHVKWRCMQWGAHVAVIWVAYYAVLHGCCVLMWAVTMRRAECHVRHGHLHMEGTGRGVGARAAGVVHPIISRSVRCGEDRWCSAWLVDAHRCQPLKYTTRHVLLTHSPTYHNAAGDVCEPANAFLAPFGITTQYMTGTNREAALERAAFLHARELEAKLPVLLVDMYLRAAKEAQAVKAEADQAQQVLLQLLVSVLANCNSNMNYNKLTARSEVVGCHDSAGRAAALLCWWRHLTCSHNLLS
jgi:hypothetical protein